MTVQELVSILLEMPQDFEVVTFDVWNNERSSVEEVYTDVEEGIVKLT